MNIADTLEIGGHKNQEPRGTHGFPHGQIIRHTCAKNMNTATQQTRKVRRQTPRATVTAAVQSTTITQV